MIRVEDCAAQVPALRPQAPRQCQRLERRRIWQATEFLHRYSDGVCTRLGRARSCQPSALDDRDNGAHAPIVDRRSQASSGLRYACLRTERTLERSAKQDSPQQTDRRAASWRRTGEAHWLGHAHGSYGYGLYRSTSHGATPSSHLWKIT